MATSTELRAKMDELKAIAEKHAQEMSKAGTAKRTAEKQIAALKDELLDTLATEAAKGKGK